MKNSKLAISLVLILTTLSTGLFAQEQTYEYAYVSVVGKSFSKKLKVVVDFGDKPEQIKAGESYSEILTNKKSYAAILNYMIDNKFELVEAIGLIQSSQGTGGTQGIIYIMRKIK